MSSATETAATSAEPQFAITPAADQIARDLGAIRKLLRQPLDAEIARGNLTGPQRTVMQVVVRQDLRETGISLKDLSKAVGLAQSTVSGIADRLERDSLLERRPDPKDGRAVRIFPTAPVLEFLSGQLPHLLNDPLRQALARVSTDEVTAIQQALTHLRQLLEST
jgi:DNA-binding MarR family transcriptional regulator